MNSLVLCGGSWDNNSQYCRSAYRVMMMSDYRNNYLGFRVVVSAAVD
jgi:formylglycine-generating enzyme required for sulfatase activity